MRDKPHHVVLLLQRVRDTPCQCKQTETTECAARAGPPGPARALTCYAAPGTITGTGHCWATTGHLKSLSAQA